MELMYSEYIPNISYINIEKLTRKKHTSRVLSLIGLPDLTPKCPSVCRLHLFFTIWTCLNWVTLHMHTNTMTTNVWWDKADRHQTYSSRHPKPTPDWKELSSHCHINYSDDDRSTFCQSLPFDLTTSWFVAVQRTPAFRHSFIKQ